MFMIEAAPAVVKPAPVAETLFLGFRTELEIIEDDAREMGESLMDEMFDALSDEEIEAMAEEAAFRDRYESGEFPW